MCVYLYMWSLFFLSTPLSPPPVSRPFSRSLARVHVLRSFSSYSLRCLIPCCVHNIRDVTHRLPICTPPSSSSSPPQPKHCERQYHGMVVRSATVTDHHRHRHHRLGDHGQQCYAGKSCRRPVVLIDGTYVVLPDKSTPCRRRPLVGGPPSWREHTWYSDGPRPSTARRGCVSGRRRHRWRPNPPVYGDDGVGSHGAPAVFSWNIWPPAG